MSLLARCGKGPANLKPSTTDERQQQSSQKEMFEHRGKVGGSLQGNMRYTAEERVRRCLFPATRPFKDYPSSVYRNGAWITWMLDADHPARYC
jgi:hypothetical protein